MIALALLVLTLPAQASLADHLPRGVHLLEPALLAQADAPLLETEATSAPVTVEQLQAELSALRRMRPSLGLPVTLVSVGGSSGLLGVLYLAISLAMGSFAQTTPFLALGLVFLGVGLPLAILGGWFLYHRLGDRTRIDAEVRSLTTQLRQLQAPPGGPPPGAVPVVTVAPPALLLARF